MVSKSRSLLYPVFYFIGINLLIFTLSRIGLALWQADRLSAVENGYVLFLQGLRIDIVSLSYLFGVPALLTLLLFHPNPLGKIWLAVLRLWLTAATVFVLFMELATPAFIETYDFRPNRLFIEYLPYPKEVFTMLVNGHLTATLTALLLTIVAAWAAWKLSGKVTQNLRTMSWKWRPIAAIGVIVVSVIGARSTFAHRGINPSLVAFSADPLVNSLVLNSGYSVLYAAQQLKNEDKSSEQYGSMPVDEMLTIVKRSRHRPDSDYISADIPTLTTNTATYRGKPKNIVIILQESLGAQFVGTLGGKPLTPELDKLAQEGWLFENLYATGTRSVRGIEAVTAGFTPTPARSTVKLSKSQQGFFTIAELLRRQGYQTSFIYGGEKHFDNMASYFYGNGFETIIDEKDYVNPKFVGTWGVSDEDLFDKAHDTFTRLAHTDKPFFSLVFSSSNHDPFEFPDGKIELYDSEKQTRNNAAKYADYAIGHFFRLAKQSDYWQNTLFIVIADHDSRVSGADLVPISNFHIPALILGDGIAPQRDARLVSQIDIPPTLLSLAGVSGEYPMLGVDLSQHINPNRAFMQYDQTQAMLKGQDVIILQPNSEPQGYRYNAADGSLQPKAQPEDMKKEALAHALIGSYLYQNQLYKLPTEQSRAEQSRAEQSRAEQSRIMP